MAGLSQNRSIHISENTKFLFEKMVKHQGINNYSISYDVGSSRGDNYLGIIIKADISGIDNEGETVRRSYIIKCAHSSEAYRKVVPLHNAYRREIYVYSTLHVLFNKFQEERNAGLFASITKCYTSSDELFHESLIMDDMVAFGYGMQDRMNSLNSFHCKFIMRELGHLHAISFALRDQNPKVFVEVCKELEGNFFVDANKEYMRIAFKNIYKQIGDMFDSVEQEEQKKRYLDVTTTMVDDMFDLSETNPAGNYGIVLHGDCWVNNFLFKYKDNQDRSNPVAMCFLDWQNTRIGSPFIDIFYFIYSCTDKKLRDEHFDEIMEEYYDSLSRHVNELGSSPEKVFPKAVFEEHMKRFGIWGLGTAHMLVPIVTARDEDIPNFVESVASGKSIDEMVPKSIREYSAVRLKDVFLHLYEKGFI